MAIEGLDAPLVVGLAVNPRNWVRGLQQADSASARFVRKQETVGQQITNSIQRPLDRASAGGRRAYSRLTQSSNQYLGATRRLSTGISGLHGLLLRLAGPLSAILIIRKATKSALEFETAMAEVSTIVDTSQVDMSTLTSQVDNLSRTMGVDAVKSAKGMYQAISAGVDATKSIGFLEQATKLAVAGIAEVPDTVDLLTTAINAYGLEVEDAEVVSDLFFKTVEKGKTTIPELASSMGQVIPIAKQGKVSLIELSGAMATLTAGGIKTAEAATQLKGLISALINPSEDAMNVARKYGLTLGATALEAKGLTGILKDIEDKVGDDTEAITKLVPNLRGMGAAMNLSGSLADKFRQTIDELEGAAGAADVAFEKMANTTQHKLNVATQETNALLRELGQSITLTTGQYIDGIGGAQIAGMKLRAGVLRLAVGFKSVWLVVKGLLAVISTAFRVGIESSRIFGLALKGLAGIVMSGPVWAVGQLAKGLAKLLKGAGSVVEFLGLDDEGKLKGVGQAIEDWSNQVQAYSKNLRDSGVEAVRNFNIIEEIKQSARDVKAVFEGWDLGGTVDDIKELSGKIAGLEREIQEAEEERIAKSVLAQRNKARDIKKVLDIERDQSKLAARLKLEADLDALNRSVEAEKDTLKKREAVFKEGVAKWKDVLKQGESAYKAHMKRLSDIDQERAKINQSLEERIFNLRLRGLNPEDQITALNRAAYNLEQQAERAFNARNFEQARNLLLRAADTYEQIAGVEGGSQLTDEIADRLERIKRGVNEIFTKEEVATEISAEKIRLGMKDLKTALSDLEARHKTWREGMEGLIKAWDNLGEATQEKVDDLTKQVNELAGQKEIIFEAITAPAIAELENLKRVLDEATKPRTVRINVERTEGFAAGGSVPGSTDTVPARLTPGEFVVNRSAASRYRGLLEAMNSSPTSSPPALAASARAGSPVTRIDLGGLTVNYKSAGRGTVEDARAIGLAILREVKRGTVPSLTKD